MKRGKYKNRNGVAITAWLPKAMVSAIDLAVHMEDSDRSKFIRNAVKDRALRLGVLTDPDPNKPTEVAA